MMLALSPPTWKELAAELERPAGPFTCEKGRYVWRVIDSRTGRVRSTWPTQQQAEAKADALNLGNA